MAYPIIFNGDHAEFEQERLPTDLPADVIAAVVGGGITSDQVTKVWGLIRAALQLREWRGSAIT